jgi:hypothetical protein
MFHRPILPTQSEMPSHLDQRRDRRHATVLLIGRVRHRAAQWGKGESACLVHDISGRGLMARFTAAPSVGDRLLIQVRGLPEVAATVRWVDGLRGGVEFDEAQDIGSVFCLRDPRGHVARAPRFAMHASASLRSGDARIAVDILDISPGGVKLRSDVTLHSGQAGSVLLPEIDAVAFGMICWTRDDRAGFRFCAPLPLMSLSRILGCG